MVAGNKLFQVVVDDELTAKALLQKGSLRRRVTIIPLNKISRQVDTLGSLRDSDAVASSLLAHLKLFYLVVGSVHD